MCADLGITPGSGKTMPPIQALALCAKGSQSRDFQRSGHASARRRLSLCSGAGRGAVAVSQFSAVADDTPVVTIKTDFVTAKVGLPSRRAFSG